MQLNSGICVLTAVPLRATPTDKAEMVTQMLFGETYQIEDSQSKWLLIKLDDDGYEGWIDRNQHEPLSADLMAKIKSKKQLQLSKLSETFTTTNGCIRLSFGSRVLVDEELPYAITYKDLTNDNLQPVPGSFDAIKFVESAKLFVNTPYLWGGKTAFGIDCSGFTQIIAKASGFMLPRDAHQQAEYGSTIDFFQEALPGDLAFFDNEEGRITHVGVVAENGTIIHASGKVRIDALDHHGIFHVERKTYTHQLRFIKRINTVQT